MKGHVQDTVGGPVDSLIEVAIVEDDVGRLAAELKSDSLQIRFGGSLHNLATDEGRSSESDLALSSERCDDRQEYTYLLDTHVRGDCRTDGVAVSGEDVDDTLGETSLLDD